MNMVSYQTKGIRFQWHIDAGEGTALCQTVEHGDVVQLEITNPLLVRFCMKCWKKHHNTQSNSHLEMGYYHPIQ